MSESDRENLPERVAEQVDYEAIRVAYVLATELRPQAAEGALRGTVEGDEE
ncbi:hypothetical protein [Wenjunlia vitaminophila]|uniref:hypothetical protein n=1 Tax=Wenjunlia vitaminophila TaxID=76728 RepID=UPI000360530B|nr:hypothetical protein [Wenjunlia vitaminophila]